MPSAYDMTFLTDIREMLAAWEEQYVSEASYEKFVRASAWVTDQSAKSVMTGMRAATGEYFKDPTPWMVQGWQYRRSLGKGRSPGQVEAEAYALDSQSAVLKYAMGDNRNRRLPGDVGLAQDRILLPHWANLLKTQGIRPNASGDLPGATMARIARNASGQYAKRSVPGRWGVYRGEINVGGSRLMGYIARPPRVRAPITDAGTERSRFINKRGKVKDPTKLVNLDRPRILLIEAPHADYQPIMQRPFESAVAEARRAVADLMASELANNIHHAGSKGGRMKPLGKARSPSTLDGMFGGMRQREEPAWVSLMYGPKKG